MSKDKQPPCRCEQWSFPHRKDWRCILLQWDNESALDEEREEVAALYAIEARAENRSRHEL